MFDDILDTNIDVGKLEDSKPQYNKSNYSNRNFQSKPDVLEDPYLPVALYVDRDFPAEVKEQLYGLASKLVAKKITIRVNGDDKAFIEKLLTLSEKFIEVYIPWKKFNDIDSKLYFNSITSKEIAKQNFSGWDKIPDSIKALLARNVRMVFGNKNNSIVLCVITWSEDAASRHTEVTAKTGRSSFIIKTASKFGFPVINIAKANSMTVLEKTFDI